ESSTTRSSACIAPGEPISLSACAASCRRVAFGSLSTFPNAVTAACARSAPAVTALGKVLSEPNATRRQLATHALSEIGSPGAMQALERVVEDSDREVRLTTARAFTARAHRPALSRLEAV